MAAKQRLTHANMDSCCCICENSLVNPCKLPCSHIICFSCVQNLVKSEDRRNNLLCPMCRGVFTIPIMPPGCIEQPPYIKEKYSGTIVRTLGCDPLQHKTKIMGMTISEDKLFVVCKKPPNVIFQYNIDTEGLLSNICTELKIEDLKWPRGMAANDSLHCLYITDWKDMFGGRLWRYDNKNHSPACVVAVLDVQPFGVSYSSRNDLILVTCATPINVAKRRGWIYTYRDHGESFQHLQNLELDDLQIPRHSVLTFADKYLACHGWTLAQHGVTAFQQNVMREVTRKTFYGSNLGGGSGQQQMNRPLSMTIDEDGLVLVVDYCNHRIQLLTEDLLLLRHLITKDEHEIAYPRHVCVHPKTGRLFVGQEDGKVLVFDAYYQGT